jgi:hypothetical protein
MRYAATFELWYIKLAIAGFYVWIIQHRFHDLWFLFSFPRTEKYLKYTNKYPAYGWFKLFGVVMLKSDIFLLKLFKRAQ